MNKLQIQLPGPLYRQLKQLAESLDYPMAELLRRGAEQIILQYPQHELGEKKGRALPRGGWELPKPARLRLKVTDPRELRRLAHERS